MKLERIYLLAGLAVFVLAVGLVAACGDDDDDDAVGDDTGPVTCEEAMDFLFGTKGCFTLTDNNDDIITADTLCTDPAYEDLVGCYQTCYDENDDCDSMGVCLTKICGLSF